MSEGKSQAVTVDSILKATNHWMVLKLSLAAVQAKPKQVITAAFRKASLRVHPDKSDDPRAAEAFVILHEAYRVLVDERARAAYQEELRAQKFRSKMTPAQEMSAYQQRPMTRRRREAAEAELRRQREEAKFEKERTAAQARKDDAKLKEAEERLKLAQRRLAAAKRRKVKQAEELAAAREKFGAHGATSNSGIAKSNQTASREVANAQAAAAAAAAQAEKVAFAARRARKSERRAAAEQSIHLGRSQTLPPGGRGNGTAGGDASLSVRDATLPRSPPLPRSRPLPSSAQMPRSAPLPKSAPLPRAAGRAAPKLAAKSAAAQAAAAESPAKTIKKSKKAFAKRHHVELIKERLLLDKDLGAAAAIREANGMLGLANSVRCCGWSSMAGGWRLAAGG